MKKLLLLLTIFITSVTQSQNVLIPNGGFSDALDIGFWSVASSTATKSWFNGGCQSMFVDNLGNPATTVTSSVFSVGLSGDYELELEYAVIYTGTAAIFELVDSNSAVISATSINTVTGTCTGWPSPKHSTLVFANLAAGNYQLRITIPSSQFFLDGVELGVHNPITVSGSVNATGCSNANMLNNFPIKITDLSDNATAYTSTINGVYNFILPNTTGNFLIEPVNNGNIVATPNGINLTINSSSTSYLNNDFCFTSNISGVEVEAQLVSQNLARPGFVASYDIIYGNNGNITTGAETIVLNFDSSKLTYVANSASVVPASVTSNSITWNYTNLTSLEFRNITFSFNVLAPPTVSGGDVLSFTGNITPIADVDPSNNTINLNQVVVNAYDPNDVLCMEGDEIIPTQIGDDLTYRIRFQNTGTAAAVNISVKTDLDADLDWATFQPISASHAYTTSVVNGNELTYTFNNINLDDATTNEPGSHGWIFYKIKPKNTVVVGDSFDATADIYFDFNPAVVTNTYTTTVVSPPLTYVPDNGFETRLIELGHDSGPLDDYVPTANIDALTTLDLEDQGIVDMTGIEDFVALEFLYCHTNSIATLDVSTNINLTTLLCSNNSLTTLDVTQNPNLTYLGCSQNQISSLTINNSNLLTELLINDNQLTSFNASGFSSLIDFRSGDNLLTSLNIKNGNNTSIIHFEAGNNPNLTCIEVDDAAWSTTNWTNVDVQTGFNEDCATTSYDGYEPNEDFATAVNIPFCNTYNPNIGGPGDVDFFTFPLESNINTEIIIDNIPVGLTYKVTFFDNNQIQSGSAFFITSSSPLTRYFYSSLNTFFYVKIESNNANYSVLPYRIVVSNPNCSLSVSEVFKSSFNAFPNPVNNSLTVSIQEDTSYSLITVNGQVIKNGQLQKGENTLNTSNLSNGLYFLQVRTKEGVSSKKIIKQ
ncbi:T9SS type A sorting domain-containing protein [Oceanihabitans sp. 2_MG-2023]|uniref:DUF7619 domain-containing protein n=1 Tax=Oceanihabitans sp. 2_MG-2023 TaxID=3062661 RepID=UPI0026E234B7|nr:T9SS type A sorting domain-containing protein [Oceanihabitans sp. 2_MG-2023]MDO6596927.1 T9SS type A sorting domain-containing protein [Oceanihabitans sp. 2_MG-2023]